jgi:hypothetical protein
MRLREAAGGQTEQRDEKNAKQRLHASARYHELRHKGGV